MTKILVVDDEPDVELLLRQKFSNQLQSKQFEFIFASNGREALKTLSEHQDINIILTDINMPDMDGLVLLSHLAEFKRIFKAVIISAYGDMSNIRKAMNRGACDFITKPIDFKDLEITILNAIEQYIMLHTALEAASLLLDLEKELAIASAIQQSAIPHHFDLFQPPSPIEIYGTMIPARQVGGDFFDFFPLSDERIGFTIADVSGKGIPGAFFMAMSRAIIRAFAQKASSPQECLREANRMLCIDNDTCMFVTTFYGVYHRKTHLIECANAGHNPPFLLKADHTLQDIARNEGIPLGVLEETVYTNHTFTLEKGDCLILYTDGVTEAQDVNGLFYTEKRFKEDLLNWTPGPLPTLTGHILEHLNRFSLGLAQSDDITLLALRQVS